MRSTAAGATTSIARMESISMLWLLLGGAVVIVVLVATGVVVVTREE